ncbi:MAG: CPBP family intramembrane metalloprotease [Coriobacteriia bacterium]|nr:CPBP family intramembrane metalloprotease [Coriobacteriia bacterium]
MNAERTDSRPPLLRPSVLAALVAWAIYEVAFYGMAALPGIPYTQWFASASNGVRTALIPLAVGSVFMLAFALLSRWDYLWRDPIRLSTTITMKIALVAFVVLTAIRFVSTKWSEIPLALLATILAAGVLVGFAEELTFRGIFLRGMRAGGRSEIAAAIWTAAAFGIFHLPNLFLGTGAAGALQLVLAAFSGLLLYVWRRQWGAIWPAMVAHGVWDISTFTSGQASYQWAQLWALPSAGITLLLGIAVLVSIVRNDRGIVAIPAETE